MADLFPPRHGNGFSKGGASQLSTAHARRHGCPCGANDTCFGSRGFGTEPAPPGNEWPLSAHSAPFTTAPLSTTASFTACDGSLQLVDDM